jgi:hypothetical protein
LHLNQPFDKNFTSLPHLGYNMTLTTGTIRSNALPDPIHDFFAPKQFPTKVLKAINDYVTHRPNCFGGPEFRYFFGAEVGDPKLPYNEFVTWWNDFDALDLQNKVKNPRRNSETHFDPVFRPQSIRHISSGENLDYNLKTLARYAGQPLGGDNPVIFASNNDWFKQHMTTFAGPGCWLVRHKDVVARNETHDVGREFIRRLNTETGATYQLDNTLLDLATEVALQHVLKGKDFFDNYSTGGKKLFTCIRASDLTLADRTKYPSILRDISLVFSMTVSHENWGSTHPCIGVGLVRKF